MTPLFVVEVLSKGQTVGLNGGDHEVLLLELSLSSSFVAASRGFCYGVK